MFSERGGTPAGGAPASFNGEHTPAGSFAFSILHRWLGIAVDNSTGAAAGSVYVVDRGNKVVDRFKLSGGEYKYESQLTGGPGALFTEPEGVATDADGDVYVSDPPAEMVREFSPGGATEIAGFAVKNPVRSVVVDSRGDIFVYGNPNSAFASARPAEIWRSSDTATSVEKVTEVPEVEGAGADGIDRATNIGYVAIDGRVVEGFVMPTPVRTGGEFGSGTFSSEIESIAVNERTGAIYVSDAGKEKIFIYQGAPARFPLKVFITGEGEVTSAPSGLSCSTFECTHEFEGEVTLTAKASAGYEFAGWIGCRPISATTCEVDRAASTDVTAVFLKAATQGLPGAPGQPGPSGPVGPAGPTGKTGPAGKVEIVTCTKAKRKQKCRSRHVTGTVKLRITTSTARATLSRHGRVLATGSAAKRAHGGLTLVLQSLRTLDPGRYMLTLITGFGSHRTIRRQSFTLG